MAGEGEGHYEWAKRGRVRASEGEKGMDKPRRPQLARPSHTRKRGGLAVVECCLGDVQRRAPALDMRCESSAQNHASAKRREDGHAGEGMSVSVCMSMSIRARARARVSEGKSQSHREGPGWRLTPSVDPR